MVAVNDKYYLICNVDKYDNVAHFRVDRMTDIKMLQKKVKPQKQVKGLENGIDLPKHVMEHIYMFKMCIRDRYNTYPNIYAAFIFEKQTDNWH